VAELKQEDNKLYRSFSTTQKVIMLKS